MRRSLAIVVCTCIAVGGLAASSATRARAASDSRTYRVAVDHLPADYAATFNYFFPSKVSAHAGDVLEFKTSFTGEPHTVALGQVVDGAAEAYDAVPAGTAVAPGSPLPVSPELQQQAERLPEPLPPNLSTPDDAFSLLQPCYLVDELPPTTEPCAPEDQRKPGPFDESYEYYASPALVRDGQTFRVGLSDSMDPGQYQISCTVHASWMRATLDVVPARRDVPSPAEVARQGKRESAALVEQYRAQAEEILDSTTVDPAPAGQLGASTPPPEVTINAFPTTLKVAAGTRIAWSIVGAHTVSFKPPKNLDPSRPFVKVGTKVVTNPLINDPSPGVPSLPPVSLPTLPDGSSLPPLPPNSTPPIVVDAGTWNGTGYLNSGLLYSVFGPTVHFAVSPSDPGRYAYYCMRHPGMVGVLEVK